MEQEKIPLERYLSIDQTDTVKPAPFKHESLKNSIEILIQNKPSPVEKTPLENMVSDKTKSLKAAVNALLEEISLREELNTYHLKIIDKEISKQNTELMNLENINDSYPFDLTSNLDDEKAKIKDNVLELEKEKRTERVECWRDLMFLKKDLMGSLKNYWELQRKRGLLENRYN